MKEFLLVLVLISGLIKGQLLFWGIPPYIDLTLISFLLLFFYSIVNYKQFSFSLSTLKTLIFLSLLIFYFWMIFTLIYTSSNDYSLTKVFLFLTNLIPLSFLLFIKEFDHRKFIKYFVLIIFTLDLTCLFYELMYISGRLGGLSINYYKYIAGDTLVLGELTGLMTLIMICFKEKQLFDHKYLARLLIGIGIVFLFVLAARGPLIFFLFSALIYFLMNLKKVKISNLKFSKALLFLVPVLVIIFFYFSSELLSLAHWSITRLNVLFSDLFDGRKLSGSTSGRFSHFTNSINLIFSNIQTFIFGKGIGSYMYEISGIDGRGYPHNIILEVWTEMGLIGLILFLFYLVFSFILKISKESKTSWVVFLYILLNLLKSNSLVDIRVHILFFAF